VAYTAWVGGWRQVVVDGKKSRLYDYIDRLVFSPKGHRLAYTVSAGSKQFVVLDGQALTRHDVIVALAFGPHGKRFAYAAEYPKRKSKRSFVVLDGVSGPLHDWVLPGSLIFSSDGRRFSYVIATDPSKMLRFVIDGKVGRPYKDMNRVTFGPKGKRYAYQAAIGKKGVMVVNGVPGRRYDTVGAPMFGPDGRFVAYLAKRDKRERVVVEASEGPAYEEIFYVRFSGRGRLHYLAGNKRQGKVELKLVEEQLR
jgi:hypothetical protein